MTAEKSTKGFSSSELLKLSDRLRNRSDRGNIEDSHLAPSTSANHANLT